MHYISTASEAGTSDISELARFIADHKIKAVFAVFERRDCPLDFRGFHSKIRIESFMKKINFGGLYKNMLGIIGAMEEEVAELKKDMQIDETIEQAGMVFCKGSLGGKDVVIVRSGIGKVNAGICAQILVDRFGVDTLINTGIAGSLDAQIDIGDMVISTDALYHDMDATIFGDPAGQIPRMDTLSFPADEKLVKKAVAANEKANPDIHTFTGRVVSGDQFISDKDVKERISSLFHPMCVEMEGAGIAQAAYLNKVSYVIIRAISDKADNSATMDYPTFEKKAIAHSVRLMKELLPMI